MPGWILVANRFSLLPIIRSNGGLLTAIASLGCLVVVSGCSNLRQQSSELPLPILPSEVANVTQAVDGEPVSSRVSRSESAKVDATAGSSTKSKSTSSHEASNNNFALSRSEQNSSVQNFLPSESDSQLQEPAARFVGASDRAKMTEIKLTANTPKDGPAPTIAAASEDDDCEDCETPEVCSVNSVAQCDCCKKKELPKLAVVEPMDPEKLPARSSPNEIAAKKEISPPLQSTLRPIKPANVASAPIRLVAWQDSEMAASPQPLKDSNSAQTENRAQMLIPIAPAELQAFKAEVDRTKIQEAQAAAAKESIKVSPQLDFDSATTNRSFTALANAASAKEATSSAVNLNPNESKYIPISSSGIHVSEIPFQALPTPQTEQDVEAVEPKHKPADFVVTLAPITGPMPKSIEVLEPVASVKSDSVVTKDRMPSNDFSPQLPNAAKAIEGFVFDQARDEPSGNEQPLGDQAIEIEVATGDVKETNNAFQLTPSANEVVDEQSKEFVASLPSENIDPLAVTDSLSEFDSKPEIEASSNLNTAADMSGLPEMSQIEKELAEFKKINTFDPSMLNESDRIDPAVLLLKLDGPPKSIAAPLPAVEVVETNPHNELITQQLAAQSSALSKLQDAIQQLKTKPAATTPAAPELTLSNAAFCTKISGFGQFKPFAANDFSGSQKTLLYCEVENQTSKQFTNFDGSQQFETVLHGSIVIYDAKDQIVQTAKFPAIKDVARHQRRDFYVYFPVQFDKLDRGDYRLELSVEDASASTTAVLRPFMRFSVR